MTCQLVIHRAWQRFQNSTSTLIPSVEQSSIISSNNGRRRFHPSGPFFIHTEGQETKGRASQVSFISPDVELELTGSTTVFVSSLPYNATTTDIITHFSFIGPVRHGFIATDKESGTSKGVGYVTYAQKEDADRAIEELDGGEFGAKGRKIRVTLADKRVSLTSLNSLIELTR